MAKTQEIQYPTQEWIDKWVDTYLDKHPTEKVSDFSALEEKATEAWWDNEIDHDRPTPFDFTEEQEKASKKARSAGRKPKTTVYKFDTTKRKKPENKNKSDLISVITGALTEHGAENLELINPEREFTFTMDGTKYKIVLSLPRK